MHMMYKKYMHHKQRMKHVANKIHMYHVENTRKSVANRKTDGIKPAEKRSCF